VGQGVVDASAPVDRDQPHARLDQPPRQQQALTVLVPAVAIAPRHRFAVQLERMPRRRRGQKREGSLLVFAQLRHAWIVSQSDQPGIDRPQQALPFAKPVGGELRPGGQAIHAEIIVARIAVDGKRA